VESLRAGTLVIEAEDAPTRVYLVLYWQGKSSDRNPEKVLEPFFLQALTEAQERKLGVEMHFEKLIHFNSSTIGYLIQLIQETRRRGMSLVLIFDHALMWQKLSFDALRVFAKDNELLQLRVA
jgi:hypothetical protein